METFLGQVFTGLSLASILLLAAVGLTFTFGQMGVINMAHGELIMIGAYSAYVCQNAFAALNGGTAPGVYYAVALVASFVVAGAIGLALEALLIHRLYGRPLDLSLIHI